jgi:hypothetical protein
MTFTVNVEPKNSIITLSYSGEVFLSNRLDAINKMYQLLTNNHCTKLIIDTRKIDNNKMTDNELEYLGEYLAEKLSPLKIKVAAIHLQNNDHREVVIDGIAFLKGCCLAQFHTKKEAVSWLIE